MTRAFTSSQDRGGAGAVYLMVFIAAATLYVATCAPGPVWQDSGMIQYRVLNNDIQGHLGLALSHPLYYGICIATKYIPIGDPAYKVNLTNAIISAFAIANLFLLLRLWLNNSAAAIIGAMSLALSHTFWRHAAIPETYNLTVALLLLELVVLLNYAYSSHIGHLYLLAIVNGLAISNHMLASIPLLCYMVLLLILLLGGRIHFKDLVLMAIFWMVGAALFEYLFIRHLLETKSILGTLSSAAFGDRWKSDVLNTYISAKVVKENIMWFVLNYPTPNILLVIVGLVNVFRVSPKKWYGGIIVLMTLMFLAFAFRYSIVDRYAFFIPFYCMVAILIAIGIEPFLNGRKKGPVIIAMLFCLLTIPAYYFAPQAAKHYGVATRARTIPYRDDYTYFLQPWKTFYDGAERFAAEALDSVASDAVILSDSTTAAPLLYTQQETGKGKGVKIISRIANDPNTLAEMESEILEKTSKGLVYVVTAQKGYCPAFLFDKCDFKEAGVLYRAVLKESAPKENDIQEPEVNETNAPVTGVKEQDIKENEEKKLDGKDVDVTETDIRGQDIKAVEEKLPDTNDTIAKEVEAWEQVIKKAQEKLPNANDTKVKETDSNVPEVNDINVKESKAIEPEAKAVEEKQPEPNDTNVKESDIKEEQEKQPDVNDTSVKEAEAIEQDIKEADDKKHDVNDTNDVNEPEMKEAEEKKPDANDIDVKEADVNEPNSTDPNQIQHS